MTLPIVLLAPISLHKQSVNSYELLNVRDGCMISMFVTLTCGSGPLHMHGSYESNFNIRINFKIINFDINL